MPQLLNMKAALAAIVLISFLAGKSAAQVLTQSQLSITKGPTKPVHFYCEVHNIDLNEAVIHWYRQRPGEGLQRILYFKTQTDSQKDVAEARFVAGKIKEKKSYTLLLTNIRADDAGTYYCAYWQSGTWRKIFGGGTRLIVTDETPKAPKIRLFPPSSDELRDTSKSVVVCLMTDFFPEVIKVEWKIGDVVQNDNVQTDSVTKMEKGNTYSLISRLSVSKLQWGDQPITCHAKHEIDVPGLKITKDSKYEVPNAGNPGGPTCPPSVQELQENTEEGIPVSSLQVATLTYTILLMKSVLYCGIISCILYKMEYWGTKKPL